MQEHKPFNIGEVFDQQRALESFASREQLLMFALLAHRTWTTTLEKIHLALEKKELQTVATEAAALGETLGFIMLTQVSAALENLAREARAGRYLEAQQAEAIVLMEAERAVRALDIVFSPPGCASELVLLS